MKKKDYSDAPSQVRLSKDIYGGWYVVDPGWPAEWNEGAPLYVLVSTEKEKANCTTQEKSQERA